MKLETPRYNIALNETLGSIHCGGVPMSIAVQTDMATPALARWDLVKLHIITNTLESVLKWQFLSSYLAILLLMLLLLVVVLWILIFRKGLDPMS